MLPVLSATVTPKIVAQIMYFRNGPEYEQRLKKPFIPPDISWKDVHEAVPKHLLKSNPLKSAFYISRDIAMAALLYKISFCIQPLDSYGGYISIPWKKKILKAAMWLTYWSLQGLVNAGIFCLGHDAGHMSLFESKVVNHVVGFSLHTYLFVPYFSWRETHRTHHKSSGSMEKDENYVPYTRSQYRLPNEERATRADYAQVFEETPLYTLARMVAMQAFGWWLYLMQNTMGCPSHPPGTNHFNPLSPLFKPQARKAVVLSDVALVAWAGVLWYIGRDFFLWHYLVPWILANHWVIMFTFLHHSDPTIPHYRRKEWTFLRGAIATVDRPLLGWVGRFFFHNISHDHVAHHLFLQAPSYNGSEITKAIKPVLREFYNFDSTPSFYALYRSFTQCIFVEDEGDIVFYKNKHGEAQRPVTKQYEKSIQCENLSCRSMTESRDPSD